MQRRTTAFVTLPIVALAAASFAVVIASLVIGAREADSIALTRQRETIEHALDQHGLALARELRVQTVWTESYERTRARDTAWMQTFYGSYLTQLLGYDRIYVLASDNTPVFGFVASDPAHGNDFSALAGGLQDLIKAVRDAKTDLPAYNVVETEVPLGNGTSELHRAVADVRAIGGRPATVVVSSILPDRGYDAAVTGKPMLLVAVEDLDKTFTKRLGDNFGFRDMAWTSQGTPSSDVSEEVRSLNGTPVGLLSWRKSRPGLEFIRRVAPGLGVALLLVMALTYLLILWGKRQAKRLVRERRVRNFGGPHGPAHRIAEPVRPTRGLYTVARPSKGKGRHPRHSFSRHRPVQRHQRRIRSWRR